MERPVPLRRLSLINNGKTRGKRGETEEGGDSTKKKSKKKKEDKPEPEVAPEFVVKPRRQFIDDGGVAKFKASYDGPSSTQLYWSKGGTVLVPDDHYKIYEAEGFHHLEVLNVTIEDNGEFTVTVLNAAGSDSATAELEVFERPKLLTTQMPEWEKSLEDLVVRQGDTAVEITCCSKDLKNPTVHWYLNDKELFSGFHTQLQHEGQLVTLTIKEIRDSDAGQVRCVMTGTNGELESACSVVVRPPEKMEPPVFVKELHDMEVEEGDKLELDVRVKGTAPVDVFWFHNNVAITRDSPHFLLASLGQSMHTLTLPRATRECSGEFVCEAYNAFGDTDTFCLVNVQEVEDPEPPSFVTRPLTLLAQEGEDVTLTCRVRGQPAPSVMWERQGVVISPCDKYQISTKEDNHNITITQLETTDAGLYVCHLHSVTGSASHTCELRVEESNRRSRAFLSKSLREPLEPVRNGLSEAGPHTAHRSWMTNQQHHHDTGTPGTANEHTRSYRGVNPDIHSKPEDNIEPTQLSDFKRDESSRGPDRSSSSSEDTTKGPPTPKPRSLKLSPSQTVSGTSASDISKDDSSFVFPALKPVGGDSSTSDKSKSEAEGSPQIDFRSVLKPRSLGPSATTTTKRSLPTDSDQATDFRSVLSKPKPRDRDFTTTPGGFPRSDPVGVELRNLQMTRTSRNVASRDNQPKFGVASIVGSRDTLSQSLPLSRSNKSHLNTAGLRMVSKNLDNLDTWDLQKSSHELPSTAQGGRQWRKAAPSYSPSSCASSLQSLETLESSLPPADGNVTERDNKDRPVVKSEKEGSFRAVPRLLPANRLDDVGNHGRNENVRDISEAARSTLQKNSVELNSSNTNNNSGDGENRQIFTLTGFSKSSKGSIRLADKATLPQEQCSSKDAQSVQELENKDRHQVVNPESLQKEQDDVPPPLPSSPPPIQSVTKPSDNINPATDNGPPAKCISVLQFTPTPILTKTPDAGSNLKPVVFNFALPNSSSSSSPKLAQTNEQREKCPTEETLCVSDTSRDENDDVFTDHLEVTQVERRGSMKAAGSVFAWEKLPSKSPETSPFSENVSKKTTDVSIAQKQAPVTKKRTCFKLDPEVRSHTKVESASKFNPSSDFRHKSMSSSSKTPQSASKTKSVTSGPSDAEFTQVKLKSTGIKAGPSSDLKKSKFLSTSTESLFFNVKLKPVAIKDDDFGEDSSLAKNAFSIKSKSKSSGDLLRDSRDERLSSSNDEVQSARERSGFSEKLSAFENKGSKTDRTDLSSKKPNFTIPKRNVISKFVSEANKKEAWRQTVVPESSNGKGGMNSHSSSKPNPSYSHPPQPKVSSTLPRNHKAPGSSQGFNDSSTTMNRSRYSDDISTRMETVPNWVKEKAFGKRASLTVDSGASTLPMRSSTTNVQNTRDRITKLKENPDAPKTPRRFKRDKPEPDDRLARTLGNDDLPRPPATSNARTTGVNERNGSLAKPTGDTDKSKSKPWARPDSNNSVPEWTQRRNLKPVALSSVIESGTKPKVNTHGKALQANPADTKTNAPAFSSLISRFNQPSTPTDKPSRADGDTISKNERSKFENKMAPVDTLKPSQNTDNITKDAGTNNLISETPARATTQIVIEPSLSPPPIPHQPNNSNVFDPKPEDIEDKESEREDSLTAGKQPENRETAIPPRFSTVKQASPPDLSAANNQPPLRNTAVRPAWKKQRSLRHIPIYPIHDNELSPRYEPFIDDSESTASISSTSSEASIVTNDSGYTSRSRANTSELFLNKPQPTKDHQYRQNDPGTQEHLKQEDGGSSEVVHDVKAEDENVETQNRLKTREGDGQIDQESDHLQPLVDSALTPKNELESDTSDVLDTETQGEDSIASSSRDFSTVSRETIENSEEAESLDESPQSTDKFSQFGPTEKEFSDTVGDPCNNNNNNRVSPDPPDITSNSDSKPTRQSLNLKNKVSYLEDSTDEKVEETPLPMNFPRRRSKFMDDYLNNRRGSEETTQSATGDKPAPEVQTTKQPPAKRPSDLDIVPKWRRSQPTSETLGSSERSKSEVGVKDAPRRADLKRNGLAADVQSGKDNCVPEFTKPLDETIEVVYGSGASLCCIVSGFPSSDVEWLFNRQPLQLSRTQKVRRDGSEIELTLTETFAEHEGVYTCRASNSEGSVETSCVLRLAVSEKSEGGRAFEGPVSLPPRITTLTPKAVSLTVGSPLTLTATFTGEPPPTVSWTLAGREIVADERIHLEHQRGTSSLTIDSLQRSHSGKMSVCVSSSIGTDQSAVNICIEDVPDAPIGKPQVYDLGRTSASLSWCGPASSGGNNVTHYSIEARTRQSGHTWDVVVSQCKELTCHILDLKPCTTYQFRVRAANRHGLGPPSEPSDKVTTFDLFTTPSDYESDGLNEVFTPSIEYREDELPFEPRHVTFNTEEKFESVYELDKEVGKGKFGTVYKCRHRTEDTTWAAKIVKCRPRDKAALRMEVEIMNKLRHPKLLMLWDAFESDRQMVLVMEYVGAGELFERVIGEDFVLTERDCIHFLRQICEGVEYMHSQCVLHLDLKPENILCLSESSNRIKIIDFGLARHHNPGESTKVLFGTPEFIAPEVINYDEIGFATDMWSVGVICYVLLSGLSPFLGDNDTETLSLVTTGEFDFDDEAFDEISDQAKDFISKLLVKRKEKRLLTSDCLQHSWLNQDEVDGARYKRLNTDRLKRFMVRRKWLKTGNAVLAVSRLMKTTSILSRQGSSQSTSEENLLELSMDSLGGPEPGVAATGARDDRSQMAENSGVFTGDAEVGLDRGAGSNGHREGPGGNSLMGNCVSSTAAGGGGGSDSNNNNNNNNDIGNTPVTVATITDHVTNSNADNTPQAPSSPPSSAALLSPPSSKHTPQSESPNAGQTQSPSTERSESCYSRTSSLASPVDAHQHPSGISFSKLMANCKACKGDAARFDITISGSSGPLRLNTSPSSASALPETSELLVSWYLDGELVVQDEHRQMSGRGSSFSLVIRSVREEDEGEYSCRVSSTSPSSGVDVLLCCRADLSVLNV